jgi:superfamily I DNA/RNA helicase
MTREQLKQHQRALREKCMQAILGSRATKKLIVAGAGTGKTYTFGKVIEQRKGGKNLAMTFIRKLVADMDQTLHGNAEVRTFHAFCKKTLHGKFGAFELISFLPQIILKDVALLNQNLKDFAAKFQMLDERAPEIEFYLKRSDYYSALGFDDAVYRLLKEIQKSPDILPEFDQIVIDEFQDFNPLEVAFIEELGKKGDILIVGDDDQAVYNDRCASPKYLRDLYASGEFERFELPFCSRCTEVVVTATNALLKKATSSGYFSGRVPKKYECFLDDKEADSKRYPKIIIANVTTGTNFAKYISREIKKIDAGDIAESHAEGKEYPTVLIVGKRHYLKEIDNQLRKHHQQINYSSASGEPYGIANAFGQLIPNDKSNLGWRILAELFLDEDEVRKTVGRSMSDQPFIELLPSDFVEQQMRAVELARAVKSQGSTSEGMQKELNDLLGQGFANQVLQSLTEPNAPVATVDKNQPTILLTSFKGCKGLSAGHVFIVGVHDGGLPRDNKHVDDVEISQFVVALTRTRKQCHILSNDWVYSPKGKKGWIDAFQPSICVDWIPKELIEDRGKLRAKDF